LADAAAVIIAAWVSALPASPLAIVPSVSHRRDRCGRRIDLAIGLIGSLSGERCAGVMLERLVAGAPRAVGRVDSRGCDRTRLVSWLRAGGSVGVRVAITGTPLSLRADALAAALMVEGEGLLKLARVGLDPGAAGGCGSTCR